MTDYVDFISVDFHQIHANLNIYFDDRYMIFVGDLKALIKGQNR